MILPLEDKTKDHLYPRIGEFNSLNVFLFIYFFHKIPKSRKNAPESGKKLSNLRRARRVEKCFIFYILYSITFPQQDTYVATPLI